MDFATIVGMALALAAILVGQLLEGGHPGSVFQVAAAVIVGGGTFGATLVQFRLPVLLRAFRAARSVFYDTSPDLAQITKDILTFATKARKEGIIALEKELADIRDPYLQRALSMAVDGVNPKNLQESMETELRHLEDDAELEAKVFEAIGGYAPTIGIIGAVLGLIHVMQSLDDPSKLGAGIATAFVATIYGIGLANILALPIAGKLRNRLAVRMVMYELMLVGVLAILGGENPRFIEDRLKGFLTEEQRKRVAEKDVPPPPEQQAATGAAAGAV